MLFRSIMELAADEDSRNLEAEVCLKYARFLLQAGSEEAAVEYLVRAGRNGVEPGRLADVVSLLISPETRQMARETYNRQTARLTVVSREWIPSFDALKMILLPMKEQGYVIFDLERGFVNPAEDAPLYVADNDFSDNLKNHYRRHKEIGRAHV